MTTDKKTVTVMIMHQACGRREAHWVEPIGWEPKVPVEFDSDVYTMEAGSIWGSEEEEAGLVYFGEAEEGENKEVLLEDLNWVYTGASGLQRLDEPFVAIRPEAV